MTLDSRAVRPRDLYAALPGGRTHGANFCSAAVEAGAAAVLTDAAGADLVAGQAPAVGVPVLVAERPRRLLGALAAAVYGDPAESMLTLGVTGTQGKTTVTYLLEAALRGAGRTPGLMGTTGTRVDGQPVASRLTTPEAPDLHALLAVMRERGVDACAHGGLQPRAGAGPGRRGGLRRRHVPQPRPRPPRLPPRHRRLLRGEGRPVHAGTGPPGGGRRRRRLGAAAGRHHGAAGHDLHDRARRRGRLDGRRGRGGPAGQHGRGARTRRAGRAAAAAAPGCVQRAQRPGGPGDPRRGGRRPRGGRAAAWPRHRACPAGWSGSTPARTS